MIFFLNEVKKEEKKPFDDQNYFAYRQMGMDILINTQIDQRKKKLRVYMPKLPTKQNQCYNKLYNIIIESQIQFNLTQPNIYELGWVGFIHKFRQRHGWTQGAMPPNFF